jgi:hypothetical protein
MGCICRHRRLFRARHYGRVRLPAIASDHVVQDRKCRFLPVLENCLHQVLAGSARESSGISIALRPKWAEMCDLTQPQSAKLQKMYSLLSAPAAESIPRPLVPIGI